MSVLDYLGEMVIMKLAALVFILLRWNGYHEVRLVGVLDYLGEMVKWI